MKRLKASGEPVTKDEAGTVFHGEPIKHLWDEYSDTLHDLKKASSGGVELRELRATVPAETMFTREVLVDGRLLDEFTRHLPGVMTGLGIIGTFAGLLEGLGNFNPATAATAVSGLGPLMEGVKHAFVASGVAIGCAMAVVFISRLTLAYFYSRVETLTQTIDSLYSTGAGEEYLSRLVKVFPGRCGLNGCQLLSSDRQEVQDVNWQLRSDLKIEAYQRLNELHRRAGNVLKNHFTT